MRDDERNIFEVLTEATQLLKGRGQHYAAGELAKEIWDMESHEGALALIDKAVSAGPKKDTQSQEEIDDAEADRHWAEMDAERDSEL